MIHSILPRIVLVGALGTVFAAQAQSLEQRVDRYLASLPESEAFHGVVLLAKGDTVLLEKGYGLASLEFGVPNGPSTAFQIGSITKPFTAILVLKLAEQGLLGLDDPITRHLPDYPAEPGNRITLRHLLTHTSGIPHHVEAHPDYFTARDKVFHSTRELWNLFARIPLKHEPGAQFTYSSPGFYLLGAILQKVSGKSYAELLREHIFEPCGMPHAAVDNNRIPRKGLATGYMRGLSGLIRAGFEDKSTALAAGDLVATARDLFRWDRGMKAAGNRILSPESRAQLLQTAPDSTFSPAGPLLKIPYSEGRSQLVLNRLSGSSTGYTAAMDRFLEPDACVIVLSNVQDAATSRIADDLGDMLARTALGIAVGQPAPETLPSPGSIPGVDRATGFYRSAKGVYTALLDQAGTTFHLVFSPRAGLRSVSPCFPGGPGSLRLGAPGGPQVEWSGPQLTTRDRGRVLGTTTRVVPAAIDAAEYAGAYTSVELQQTFRFVQTPGRLKAEGFLGLADGELVFLEKDLFGSSRGFLRFARSASGTITGFTFHGPGVDAAFGTRFQKL